MSIQDVPAPWAQRMTDRGFTRRDGSPNISALARAIGVSVETARRAVLGIGVPSPPTVQALMDALGSDVQTWLGRQVELGVYAPPAESALLSERQRKAVTEIIRVMVDEPPEAPVRDPHPSDTDVSSSSLSQDGFDLAARKGTPDQTRDTFNDEGVDEPGPELGA